MTDPDSPTETEPTDKMTTGDKILFSIVLLIIIGSAWFSISNTRDLRKDKAQIAILEQKLATHDEYIDQHLSGDLPENFILGQWVTDQEKAIKDINAALGPYKDNDVLPVISGALKVHNVATLVGLVKALDSDMDGITNERDLCPNESTMDPATVPDVNQDGCNDDTDSTARLAKFGINGVKGVRKVGASWRVTYTATAKSPADEAEIKFEVSCLALDNEGKELAADATIADGWTPTNVDKCFVRPASAS
ncbi:hypothetical protein HYW18_03740 [Candidatus Uhrbacteria bacterium]|nr:hypothetical protein [Candidatus Uhrbacteria bacterium]